MSSAGIPNEKLNKLFLPVLAVIAALPVALIFNDNIWFDEAYTLALIRHSFGDVIGILKTDMHPPLYFISLKAFCEVFGYSVAVTKLFSVLGFSVMILAGGFLLKKHFGVLCGLTFALCSAAMPMSFYFSVQQRSYSWTVCFVALCFTEAVLAVTKGKHLHFVLMALTGLLAAYDHFLGLLAVGIVYAFVNLWLLIKDRRLFLRALIADGMIIAGYSLWILPLLSQAGSAASEFWLNGVEPLSVVIFAASCVIVFLLLLPKANRRLETVFAAVCVLSLQACCLLGTLLVRPFYIGRYSVVISGIAACLVAFSAPALGKNARKTVTVVLCALFAANFAFSAVFEYQPHIRTFRERFKAQLGENDAFLYCDSAFGVMSYYYPDNLHICTFRESWFSAFENVRCVETDEMLPAVKGADRIWVVKFAQKKFPQEFTDNFTLTKTDEFQNDFNTYEVYEAVVR